MSKKPVVYDVNIEPIAAYYKVQAVNEELGLIMGYGLISRELKREYDEDGIMVKAQWEDYYDLQGDHIPEDVMFRSAADFMKYSRQVKAMHRGKTIGTAIFAWPLTEEINKAMGVRTDKTGFMLGVKVDDPEILARYKSGELPGFSMGGYILEIEEEEAEYE